MAQENLKCLNALSNSRRNTHSKIEKKQKENGFELWICATQKSVEWMNIFRWMRYTLTRIPFPSGRSLALCVYSVFCGVRAHPLSVSHFPIQSLSLRVHVYCHDCNYRNVWLHTMQNSAPNSRALRMSQHTHTRTTSRALNAILEELYIELWAVLPRKSSLCIRLCIHTRCTQQCEMNFPIYFSNPDSSAHKLAFFFPFT